MLTVDPVYQQYLDALRAFAEAAVAADAQQGMRTWWMPPGFTGDLLNVRELHEPAFNRDELNTAYAKVMQDPAAPGTTAEAVALKLQIDDLASAERAWRFRHASVCRQLAHASGRQYGLAYGSLYDTIRDAVSNLLRAAGPQVP